VEVLLGVYMFSALFGRRKKRKKERKKVKDGRKERSRSAFRTCAFRWQKKEIEKEKKKTGEVEMPLKLYWMALREKRKK